MAPGTHSTYFRSQAEPYSPCVGQLTGLRASSRHGPAAERHLGTWRGISYHAAYLSHYRDPRAGRSAVGGQSRNRTDAPNIDPRRPSPSAERLIFAGPSTPYRRFARRYGAP
jgi:hypothetical protein